jgi:uncharacterized membrane protein
MILPLAITAPDLMLESIYVLTGIVLVIFAIMTLRDPHHPHPIASSAFWFILGAIFIFGSFLPHAVTGILVLAMVALDGAGRVKPSVALPTTESLALPATELFPPPPTQPLSPAPTTVLSYASSRTALAPPATTQSLLGNKIFLPVLTIPSVTVLFALAFRILNLDANKGALIGLGFGGIAAMFVVLRLTRDSPAQLMNEGRRLNECMGAVNILPQLLASLGIIFTAAGVGDLIAHGIIQIIPKHSLFLLIVANCLGMTLFTMVMGNSFAAFPVIAAGVLVPLIIKPFGVTPEMAAIITLTAGSSGTLITPMAANFNIVPAALLEMKNPSSVLKFQLPYALVLWPMHVVVMWMLIRLF